MSKKVNKLLNHQGENYILPFFWQHGEDEVTLRKYMQVIDESNIKAVCVESRPHPDFCGPKWWEDMDIILDEARKRNMKVWILDDSHFPTGYANGAMKEQPDELCRQGICCKTYDCTDKAELILGPEELLHPKEWKPNYIETFIKEKELRVYSDDTLFGIYAVSMEEETGLLDTTHYINLKEHIHNNSLNWTIPQGRWKVYVMHLSRNVGYHRSYINMMDRSSCRVLIDAVYEKHYEKYKDDFGTTIAGFFSDEPELGNGHLYEQGVILGKYEDLPWSKELEDELRHLFGDELELKLALLWEENADSDRKAKVRYTYMDAVTRLVEKNFSMQIGDWCRSHGVQYIGHLIEDNNQHARLGSSLGHYYRGLSGQDMAGIDNIGGQVLPQQEDVDVNHLLLGNRIGEFYHYMLGKLASSAAAIEPLKKGRSMCEIFGAYGWSCGVRLEKYLVDHFLVRGVNHYVPHAFNPKEFPDLDCPPHFYAHGHNPQYRHFGKLMAYTNRVCELINHGRHIAPVAVIYHGEGEWTGESMFSHKVGHFLADDQIEYDIIPQDVFAEEDRFHTVIEEHFLRVNTQKYKVVIVPGMQFVSLAFAKAAIKMQQSGIHVWFVGRYPEGICDAYGHSELIEKLKACKLIDLEQITDEIRRLKVNEISILPANNRMRYFHYLHEDETSVYLFVNEGTEIYHGTVLLQEKKPCYIYDAWDNCVRKANYDKGSLTVTIEPLKSLIVIFDEKSDIGVEQYSIATTAEGEELTWEKDWNRSICSSIDYPAFKETKEIVIPDSLAEELPKFSGFVRYETHFN